jgi:hypothetical protein
MRSGMFNRLTSFTLRLLRFSLVLALPLALTAQIYSPKLLRVGQPDSTDLKKFAAAICEQAHAHTSREKAEAIWRFFLTDGRYVKPGFWYHIAGWTYEEPSGEVLDPLKLLNSYGFGLCYHIAPLLAAVYDAAGFDDARVWFLTGHTVAEVFFEGHYHYFDSDMMGYNVEGLGDFHGKPVASVLQLETNRNIILGKLLAPNKVKPGVVDTPWYPADVAASAMKGLSDLFTTVNDNHLFSSTRYASNHSMAYALRPGEKLIRYFKPEAPDVYYLPYAWNGKDWTEFPKNVPEYRIRTADGPRSQKDDRTWSTGRIEYEPPDPPTSTPSRLIEMPSPYVVIDASMRMNAEVSSAGSSLVVDTSIDRGLTWDRAGELNAVHHGSWQVLPRILVTSANGRKTAVSGSYGYLVRLTAHGNARASALQLRTRFQVNGRSLPFVSAGDNQFVFSSAAEPEERITVATSLKEAPATGFRCVTESGQEYLRPTKGQTGTILYKLTANADELNGFDAGARFLQIKNGIAPDKLTAETRQTMADSVGGTASLAWSYSPEGPFQLLWDGPAKPRWRDGQAVDRLLVWPEVFKQVRGLRRGTSTVYVRFNSSGPAIDSIRLAFFRRSSPPSGQITITQLWHEGTTQHQHVEKLTAGTSTHRFSFPAGANPQNDAVIFENKGQQ